MVAIIIAQPEESVLLRNLYDRRGPFGGGGVNYARFHLLSKFRLFELTDLRFCRIGADRIGRLFAGSSVQCLTTLLHSKFPFCMLAKGARAFLTLSWCYASRHRKCQFLRFPRNFSGVLQIVLRFSTKPNISPVVFVVAIMSFGTPSAIGTDWFLEVSFDSPEKLETIIQKETLRLTSSIP